MSARSNVASLFAGDVRTLALSLSHCVAVENRKSQCCSLPYLKHITLYGRRRRCVVPHSGAATCSIQINVTQHAQTSSLGLGQGQHDRGEGEGEGQGQHANNKTQIWFSFFVL